MSDPRTAAATKETMRRAALRHCADPARLARAVRVVSAALELGLLTPADVLSPEDHQQRAGA